MKKVSTISPLRVFGVGQGDELGIASIPKVLGELYLQGREFRVGKGGNNVDAHS